MWPCFRNEIPEGLTAWSLLCATTPSCVQRSTVSTFGSLRKRAACGHQRRYPLRKMLLIMDRTRKNPAIPIVNRNSVFSNPRRVR